MALNIPLYRTLCFLKDFKIMFLLEDFKIKGLNITAYKTHQAVVILKK